MAHAREKERVPQVEFIHAFQSSTSYKECADKLGITERSVWVRAKNFRKAGVRLREYARATGFSRINADRLNALIDSLSAEDSPTPATNGEGDSSEAGSDLF
jgi:biotin operon repressor